MQKDICENALCVLRDRLISAAAFVMVFVYASTTFTVLKTFRCDLLEDGIAYLRADYNISCSTTLYRVYRAYAGLMVGIYTIGTPGFFSWWLFRNRKDLQSEQRRSIPHLRSFGSIWIAYTPSRDYYEVIECGRRILYVGSAILGRVDHRVQSFAIFVEAVVTVVLDGLHPFENSVDTALYRWGNVIVFGSVFVSIIPGADDPEFHKVGAIIVLSDMLLFANIGMAVTVLVQGARQVRKSREKGTVTIVDLPVRNRLSQNLRDEIPQARAT